MNPTFEQLKNHVTRAVYSMPFADRMVMDVVLKPQSFQIHLVPKLPYGYTSDLMRRLSSIRGHVDQKIVNRS